MSEKKQYTREDIQEKISRIAAEEYFDSPEAYVDFNTPIHDLGDSLETAAVIARLENELGILIPPNISNKLNYEEGAKLSQLEDAIVEILEHNKDRYYQGAPSANTTVGDIAKQPAEGLARGGASRPSKDS